MPATAARANVTAQLTQLDNFSGTGLQTAVFEIDFARVYAIAGVSQ